MSNVRWQHVTLAATTDMCAEWDICDGCARFLLSSQTGQTCVPIYYTCAHTTHRQLSPLGLYFKMWWLLNACSSCAHVQPPGECSLFNNTHISTHSFRSGRQKWLFGTQKKVQMLPAALEWNKSAHLQLIFVCLFVFTADLLGKWRHSGRHCHVTNEKWILKSNPH